MRHLGIGVAGAPLEQAAQRFPLEQATPHSAEYAGPTFPGQTEFLF